jgi:hypothetical protein
VSKVAVVAVRNDALLYLRGELVLQSPRSSAVRLSEPADPSWSAGMTIAIVGLGAQPTAMLGVLKSLPTADGIISVTPFDPLT